jgi:hypothetical protein
VSIMLRVSLKNLVRYERHLSSSTRDSALTWKLFIGEFLNTGVLALIVFTRRPSSLGTVSKLKLLNGEFDGITPRCARRYNAVLPRVCV